MAPFFFFLNLGIHELTIYIEYLFLASQLEGDKQMYFRKLQSLQLYCFTLIEIQLQQVDLLYIVIRSFTDQRNKH